METRVFRFEFRRSNHWATFPVTSSPRRGMEPRVFGFEFRRWGAGAIYYIRPTPSPLRSFPQTDGCNPFAAKGTEVDQEGGYGCWGDWWQGLSGGAGCGTGVTDICLILKRVRLRWYCDLGGWSLVGGWGSVYVTEVPGRWTLARCTLPLPVCSTNIAHVNQGTNHFQSAALRLHTWRYQPLAECTTKYYKLEASTTHAHTVTECSTDATQDKWRYQPLTECNTNRTLPTEGTNHSQSAALMLHKWRYQPLSVQY